MSYIPGPGRARDEARRRVSFPPVRPVLEPLVVRYAKEYAQLLRIAKPVMWVLLLLVGGLFADYYWANEQLERVNNYERIQLYTSSGRGNPSRPAGHEYRHFTARGWFDASEQLPNGSEVLVRRTPVLRIATAAYTSPGRTPIALKRFFSTFNLGIIAVLALAATLALLPVLDADKRTTAVLAALTAVGWLLLCLLF